MTKTSVSSNKNVPLKFIYSERAQNFAAFSKYVNFKKKLMDTNFVLKMGRNCMKMIVLLFVNTAIC